MSPAEPSVVIVHDFMEVYGGAERVTHEMSRAFPDAPVYAIVGRPSVAQRLGIEDRFHSLLPPRERLLDNYRALTPLYPALARAVRLPEADVLLSSSYAFAHHFRTRNDAPQVCYCHTPLRFAWTVTDAYRDATARHALARPAFDGFVRAMQAVDRASSRRVDRYLTQSGYTVGQIERFYGRSADPIGAPVDCDVFRPSGDPPGDYFLLVSRLFEASKSTAFVAEAFRDLPDERLVVAGTGPALEELRATAPPNVTYVGHLDDEPLVELMQGCRAIVFPSHDAFGLIAVEAMACGRPVLAYAKGGALETVVPGVTGEHFPEQTAQSVADAIRAFDPAAYDPVAIRDHALQWDAPRFRERLVQAVRSAAR